LKLNSNKLSELHWSAKKTSTHYPFAQAFGFRLWTNGWSLHLHDQINSCTPLSEPVKMIWHSACSAVVRKGCTLHFSTCFTSKEIGTKQRTILELFYGLALDVFSRQSFKIRVTATSKKAHFD